MDRIEEWRLFVSVARMGSFVRAAERQRVSPQAVTRAIAGLEARVGSRLLHRTTRSVSLTSEGERYLERAQRSLLEFEQLESPMDHSAHLRGVLSVTAPVLFGQLHLVPLVVRFLELHPSVNVRLFLVDRVVPLAEEGLDLGVRIGVLPDSALRARRLGQVRSVLCASPAYLERAGTPRSAEALTQHSCIAFTATTPIPERWGFVAKGRPERRISVRARLVVNTGQAAIEAALAGVGVVRLFSYQVAALVAARKLRIVLESLEPEPVPAHLVQLPGARSRLAEAFTELAAVELAKPLNAGPWLPVRAPPKRQSRGQRVRL